MAGQAITTTLIAFGGVSCALTLAARRPSAAPSAGTSTTASANASINLFTQRQFFQSVRSRGVPDFPDPTVPAGDGIAGSVGPGVNPRSPAFEHAVADCGGV
jgi:hypothetical protein